MHAWELLCSVKKELFCGCFVSALPRQHVTSATWPHAHVIPRAVSVPLKLLTAPRKVLITSCYNCMCTQLYRSQG